VAGKSDFTTEEWNMLLGSPMLAGMAVSLAEPSGLWGMMKEGIAGGRALLDAKNAPNGNALVKALVADIETSEGRGAARSGLKTELTGKTPQDVKAQVLAVLADVGRIVDAKAPADAAEFKGWLKHVAEQAAEAASEGGFLGFGGVKVSEAEKATIAEVSAALKLG
jgi:hypothetical protein